MDLSIRISLSQLVQTQSAQITSTHIFQALITYDPDSHAYMSRGVVPLP